MATKIYGASDDLIEFEGDVAGEAGYSGHDRDDDKPPGCLVVCSDGTVLRVHYGKPMHGGVWLVELVNRGLLFERIDVCVDEDATPYSDVAHFGGGLKWAIKATGWERIQ